MRREATRALVALSLAATLAACTPPPTGPAMSAAEAAERIGALGMRAGAVLADPSVRGFGAGLEGLAPASLPEGEGSDLPRGVYELDEASGDWVQVADSDDLDLNWTEDGEAARLLIDWDAASPTVRRTLADGEEVELPTGASASLAVAGEVVADVDQTAAWPINRCGTLTEPGDVAVDGVVRHGQAQLTLDRVSLSVDAGETAATASTSGRLGLGAPAGGAWASWDVRLDLDVTRDEATCRITDGAVVSGRLRLDAGVVGDGGEGSFGVATDFAPVVDPATQEVEGLELTNGRLTLGATLAATWDGVLDDANGNGVPGENLVLTFEDGSMSLEELILERLPFLALGSRVAAALR